MEAKVEAVQKNITANTKGLLLPEHSRLKNFIIPKRISDKDLLTECSTNQRDYSDVKQRLNQSCLDTECNLESLWHFDKIEMVHNKDLEEEFVAKRAKLREEGRQDKELSSFLVVSKDEVSKICQSGLHTSNSTKKELSIMKELGNPQLGVYLFRYVDIALNYASKYSIPIENIIIFRVLLGKVKKIQPPKGKKKVALDPTPNFDCHMSRIHPSLKDSVEDQSIGSLVYFYEYNDLSKPVAKPRQCLPYAVVKVKCFNQKVVVEYPIASLKRRPKRLPKHKGRGLPLENCTRVTRIGKDKLIYEHFRKPEESCAVNLENNASTEVPCFSESTQNWNGSVAETQQSKVKHKLNTRWDSVTMETNELNLQHTSNVNACRDVRSDHMGEINQNPLKVHPGVPSVCDSSSSTVITSRLIKDPRLTKREQNLGNQNEEAVFHGILQCKNQLEYNSKIPTTLGLSYPVPEEFFLLNSSKCALSHRQFMEKVSWEERTLEECISPSLLNKSKDYSVNDEQGLGNVNQLNKGILTSQNTHIDHTLKTNLRHGFLKSEDYGNKNSNRTSAGDLKSEGTKHSKLFSSLLNPSKTVGNEWKSQESEPVCITVHNKKQELILELPFCDDTNISICNQNPESVTPGKDEMDNRGKTSSQLQNNDGSEIQIMIQKSDYDTSCAKNNCSSLEREYDGETGSVQDHNLESEFHRKICLSEYIMKETWTEDSCEWSLGDQMGEDDCEQNKTQAILQYEKSSMTETPKQTNKLVYSTSERTNSIGEREEYAINKADDSFIKENVSDIDNVMYLSHNSCKTDIATRGLSEKPMHVCESASLDKNIFKDKCRLSLKKFVDRQRNLETDSIINTCGFDQVHTWQLEEGSHCEEKSRRYTPEIQIHSATENAAEKITEGQANKDLEKSVGDIKTLVETSDNSDTLDLEGSSSDFYLNFQETRLLTETQLMKIENDKQQNLEAIYKDITIPDLKVPSEIHIESEGCKKCHSVPQKSGSHGNLSGEQATHLYLQERMDWESLFGKPNLNTQPLGSPLRKENERETLGRRKTGVEEETELFNTSVWPDLQITVTSMFQPKLNPCPLIIPGYVSDLPCCSDNVRTTTEQNVVSKKSTSLDTKDIKTTNDEHITNHDQKIYVTVTPGNNSQENVTTITGKTKQAFSFKASRCSNENIAKHLNSAFERPKLPVHQPDKIKDGDICECNVQMSTLKLSTPVQTTSESSANINISQTDISRISPIFKMLENGFSNEKEILEIPSIQQEKMSVSVGRCIPSSDTFLSSVEDKHDARVSPDQLTPQINEAGPLCLKTKLDSLSKRNLERYCSDKPTQYFTGQKQDTDVYSKKNILQSEYCSNKRNEIVEQKLYTDENGKYKPVAKTVKQLENNADKLSSSDNQLSHVPLDDDLVRSSNNYVLKEPEGKEEETEISATKKDFSGLEPYIIRDIPVKPLVEVALEQKDITPSKESTCSQLSSKNTSKVVGRQSPLRMVSERGIGSFTATDNPGSRLNEKYLSNEDLVDSEIMQFTKAGVEHKSLDCTSNISEILQKADETSSLALLCKLIIVCRNVLPTFIRAFEKKQGCSFEHVLVSREIVRNAERNIWTGHKLKPCAIESLIELQIIMETIEFIENKKRLLEGELTFRSLLWYDDSLCSELFGGQSGYQQQSNFYPAFQRRLKYSAINELQSYHKQLVEAFEKTRWQNHSYYSILKSRREIEECEAALKSSSHFSDFFLSVPCVCGANYGDTLEDLENARKSIVDLINVCKSLPGIAFSAEKEEHLWIIMEIIATKNDFIKTCEELNMNASLFGLEHIFFDAAKSLAWGERDKFINEGGKGAEEQSLKANEAALSKFYEIYEHMVEKLENGNFCSAPEENVLKNSSEESYNCEKKGGQQEANYYIRSSLVLHLDIGYISKILDEAQSANVNKLQQLMCRCTEHLEILKKCFQIVQEENVSNVLITKENVLGFMKRGGINAVILKPEAVEVYTEMAMIYETVTFLKNSIARKVDKPRFRSLLWFDESLLPELFRCQENIASFSYRKDNILKVIESSISELQDELNVVCDYAEKLNCSYAVLLLTRELRELSETRNLLQTSKSSISMCVDFVPYTISLNYGSTVFELDCNYNQFSLLLEKLMMADTKDLGKMAHIMKIMKTIEHMKFVCTEHGKSPLPVAIYQMLKNWRKSCQLKRQDPKTHLNTIERHSTEHSIYVSSPQVLNSAAVGSHAHQKRPASVTSKDNPPCTYEENDDSFHSKKKKVVASLMTTTKKAHEKETSRNPRKSAKCNFLKGKELHLNISTDNTWNTKVDDLKEGSPISPSCSKDLKVAYPLECIQSSPNASASKFVHSNTLQNLADLKGFNKSSSNCCQNAKQYNQKCFTSYEERSKDASVSSTKLQLPLRFTEDSATSVAKLGGSSFVPAPLNEHCNLKPDISGNTLGLIPDCSTAISLTSEHDKIGRESEKISVMSSCAPAYSDSSEVTELNEMELLCTEPSSNENIKNTADCSALSQNENVEEIPQMYTYRTVYPYSWYYCQTGSSSHSVTQTYQEVNSYETYHLSSDISTTTSTVYNAQSSMFYSQTLSQFGVGESQRYNFVQTYPICGYFSSSVPFLYNYQQQPLSWYPQAAFPYPSNRGM